MSWNARRAAVVLLALLVAVSAVWLEHGHAQVRVKAVPAQPLAPVAVPAPDVPGEAGMNPDGFLNSGISLPKDEKGRKKAIEAAVDYINDENWAVAIDRLQKLLEIDEDVFVHLTRKNAEGKEVPAWVSVKQEADRLVGTLPPAGLDFYKLTYGAKAADLLKKARQNGDPALLAEVMKKYAHTDAGGEAIKLLADYHLDRGNYIAAVLCYSKLFTRQGADKLPPEVKAKWYIASRMAPASSGTSGTALGGNTPSARELWRQLHEQARELRFGDQTFDLDEFEQYVQKMERPNFNQNATDSVVYRATPNRGNQLVGGPAFMSALWRTPMMYGDDKDNSAARGKITEAMKWSQDRNQPVIPAFAPITVTVTRGETKTPLLIYKNYWGVVARDLKTGEIAWACASNWGLERLLRSNADARKQRAMTDALQFYVNQGQHPQLLWENSTVGTLSTDGQLVYAVEDLAVPPPQAPNVNMGFPGGANPSAAYGPDVQDAIAHNRLQAFDLRTSGKLTFELGGDEKGPLGDCYFLGPPLPLGGKLYVLTEKQQELRLVCLEVVEETRLIEGVNKLVSVPRVVSTQTLGTTQEKMQNDVLRRTSAAHPAYGEGILVCPTNAGAVFGINLLENSLVWAYPYREKNDQAQQTQHLFRRGVPVGPGMVIGPDGRVMQATPNHNHWKTSAPVICDGKVVFTAPDARSLHCINLRDGSPLWKKPKQEDDLYLGNVSGGTVLVVGKKSVRGLSLSTGETLWALDTGMPSGQGIGSDNVYYLPLKEAGRTKEPQIVAIDIERGKVVGGSKSRPRSVGDSKDLDVPGNLLFYEGDVVSLTADEVVVYPQVKVKIAEMDARIAKNPNDPVGLTERGELRLDKGDLAGAIEDLTTALHNEPDKATRARARAKLYDTLTAYIAERFNDAEKYLKDYEDLCDVRPEDVKDEKDLVPEQRRRRATFLWLVGKGREEQGRLVEAFEKYQRFAEEAGDQQELVPAVDERQVKAAPDVWSRGRIVAMMAKARPEHRAPLEQLIAQKWDKLRQTNDLNALRQFVRMFGSVSAAGQEARLQLVDRLMEQKEDADEHPFLEAELELNQFRTGEHPPELAARATESLARLYTRKKLLEDAAYCYRKLGTVYARVPVRDGKTGRDIYDEVATDKRILPYLDEPDPLGAVKLKAKKEVGDFKDQLPAHGQLFQFEHSGEDLPYFRRHIVGLSFQNHEFKLFDRGVTDDNGAPHEAWTKRLTATMFQSLVQQVLAQANNNGNVVMMGGGMAVVPGGPGGMLVNNAPPPARFPYRTTGHLVVLPVGHMVYGIDPVNRRVLWEKNLAAGSGVVRVDPRNPNGPTWQGAPVVDPRDGSVLLAFSDNWAQRLGETGPLEGQALCVQTKDELTALDPISGRVLWKRADVNPRNYLFADDQHVFVVELDNENKPHASRVFRSADGISVKAPDFSALFAKRLQVLGRHLLVSELGAANAVVLRLHDALTGQDVWKETYPARSLVARSEDPDLTAVVEPDGKVHVIDLRQHKEVMAGQMANPAEDLRNVQTVHLLADRKHFYLACEAAPEANNAANRLGGAMGLQSNVMTQLGMRTLPVNGRFYAFERDSGEVAWHALVKNQFLVLDQFADLPVVLFTARQQEFRNLGAGGQRWVQAATALSFEKRNGRMLIEESLPGNTNSNFYGVHVDARAGTVDFLSLNLKITHYPWPDSDRSASAPAGPPAPKAEAGPEARRPLGGNVRPAAVERVRIREVANPLPPP